MIKKILGFLLISSAMIHPVFAGNAHSTMKRQALSSKTTANLEKFVGTWEGKCSESDENLKIVIDAQGDIKFDGAMLYRFNMNTLNSDREVTKDFSVQINKIARLSSDTNAIVLDYSVLRETSVEAAENMTEQEDFFDYYITKFNLTLNNNELQLDEIIKYSSENLKDAEHCKLHRVTK